MTWTSPSCLPFSLLLPLSSSTSLLCLPQPLSLRQAPRAGRVDRAFSLGCSQRDADVSRATERQHGMWCHLRPCSYGTHRTTWSAARKENRKKEGISKSIPEQLLLRWWWLVMCSCLSTEVQPKVFSMYTGWPPSDCSCQSWLLQISTRIHQGYARAQTSARANAKHLNLGTGRFSGNSHAE